MNEAFKIWQRYDTAKKAVAGLAQINVNGLPDEESFKQDNAYQRATNELYEAHLAYVQSRKEDEKCT